MINDERDELFTVREVARQLRVDATTVRRWIKNGALEAITLPHRGKRNEPKYATLTARFIAGCIGVSFEELVDQTDKNVYTMFSKLKS